MPIAGLYPFTSRWHEHGTLWIYSDPHFDDKDLEKVFPNRPLAEEHIKLINSKVGKNDTLILLGDVGNIERIKSLKGYKILIQGNHDCGRTAYERRKESLKFDKDQYSREEALQAAKSAYPGCSFSIEEKYDVCHAPFIYWHVIVDNRLFDEVYEGPLMISEKLILSHEPLDVPWAFNIHGHDHSGAKRINHLNVCSDVINYSPINMNQFMKSGALRNIQSIHRSTIDKATEKKKTKKR